MAKLSDYEVKTTIRMNMNNPDYVLVNNVIQNLDPSIFKSKNQFILEACKFYIDNYGKDTFIAKIMAIPIKRRTKRQHSFDN